MSLIGTAVGALVALVAKAPKPETEKTNPRFIAGYDAGLKDGRLEVRRYIGELERELTAERALSTHWIGAAARIARAAREEREQLERESAMSLYARYQDALRREMIGQYQPQQQLLAQNAQQAQAQAMQNITYEQQANQQLGVQHQNQQFAWAQHRGGSVFEGFCNCVPSRGQMFDAMVEQLNALPLPR